MIELDLTHFGRRDACDCVKRDIDHRNALLGSSSIQRRVRLTICSVSSSVLSFAAYLVSRLRDAALPVLPLDATFKGRSEPAPVRREPLITMQLRLLARS